MDLLRMSMSEAIALSKSESRKMTSASNMPLSTTATLSNHRAVKRRASRACHYCRTKKIKCSVVKSGSPCNTCRLDEVECVVSMVRRKRRPRIGGVLVDRPLDSSQGNQKFAHAFEQPSVGDDILLAPISEYPNEESQVLRPFDSANDTIAPERTANGSSVSPASTSARVSPVQLFGTPFSQQAQAQADSLLPKYIRPLPLEMNPDDLAVVAGKGAFHLPGTTVRNELLRKFVEYVHPLLPLLEIRELLQAIYDDDGNNQISLMLFHAVMLAAAAFVDIGLLQAEGFADRKTARKAFFQKAKVLYESEYETDRVSAVQALLLMTYWYDKPEDLKDPSHWMGESLSFAYTIGLHQKDGHGRFNVQKQRLRRRLWWCCFMRDQLITLSMRKPTRIKIDYDIPMLVIDDFDIQPLDAHLVRLLGGCPAIYDVAARTMLATICIEKVKLCICIHDILATQYSESIVNMARWTVTPDILVMLMPKQTVCQVAEFRKCEQQLDEWNENLSQECYFRDRAIADPRLEDLGLLSVHRAVLNMLYLTASSALHRPQVVSELPHAQSNAFDLRRLSLRRAKEAAVRITNIAQTLHAHSLTRFLPPVAVTIIITPIMMSLLEIKAEPTISNTSIHRFQQCVQVLQNLQEIWASADYAYAFLDAAVRKSHIEIVQGMERRSVQSIADLMTLPDPLAPRSETYLADAALPRASTEEANHFNLIRQLRPDFATSPAASGMGTETESVAETNRRFNEEFEALVDFNAFSESFGAGAGLGVDWNGFWTCNI